VRTIGSLLASGSSVARSHENFPSRLPAHPASWEVPFLLQTRAINNYSPSMSFICTVCSSHSTRRRTHRRTGRRSRTLDRSVSLCSSGPPIPRRPSRARLVLSATKPMAVSPRHRSGLRTWDSAKHRPVPRRIQDRRWTARSIPSCVLIRRRGKKVFQTVVLTSGRDHIAMFNRRTPCTFRSTRRRSTGRNGRIYRISDMCGLRR